MAELSGTNLAGSIVPFTTEDTFATHLAKFGKGGWRSVADTAERDGITADRREAGMAVYVVAEKKVYILSDDLTTWTDLQTGGSDLGYTKDEIDGFLAAIEAQIDAQATAITNLDSEKLDKDQGSINAGKVLTVGEDGFVVPSDGGTDLPDQAGNYGKFLTTDGENASWGQVESYNAGDGLILTGPFENDTYRQVDFIEFSGNEYVDTGLTDRDDYEYSITIYPTVAETSTRGIFGFCHNVTANGVANAVNIIKPSGAKPHLEIKYTDTDTGKGKTRYIGISLDVWYTVESKLNSIVVNGRTAFEYERGYTNFPAKIIFGTTVGGSSTDASYWTPRTKRFVGKISRFKVTQVGSGVAHNFVSAINKKTNEAGFYDIVTDTFVPITNTASEINYNVGLSGITFRAEHPIPSISANSGKFLSNNGNELVWADVDGGTDLPDQTDNAGKYLSTDGENLSWEKVNDYTAGEGLVLTQPFENDEYKQIEYIESTGDIYVDTGVLDDTTYEYKARFQPTSIEKPFSTLFGYLSGNVSAQPGKNIRIEVRNGVKTLSIGYTDNNSSTGLIYNAGAMDELAWHNVSYKRTSVELDGATLLEFNPYSTRFPAKMVLFGAWVGYSNDPAGPDWGYRAQYAGKIASFEVYNNTDGTPVLIHNFIPVKSKTTDEAGFYDTINDTFHPVVSTVSPATWTKGPESAIIIELEQPVPQVSLNAGKFLTNDGEKLYWADVASGGGDLPDQTDNAGKFLMTDGTDVSWQKAIQNNATVDTSLAIGYNTSATYTYGVAIGYNATIKNKWSIAIGYNAQALSHDQVVIGQNAAAGNKYAVAIGHNATATAEGSVQIGRGENTEQETLQFRDYTVIKQDGVIPPERLSPEPPAEGFTLVYDGQAGELRWAKSGGGETAGTEVIIRRWN